MAQHQESEEERRNKIRAMLERISAEEKRLAGNQQLAIELPADVRPELLPEPEVERPDSETESLLDNTENPGLSKRLWHDTQKIILKNTEKGENRRFILNEKNLFLKASANTSDSKFSFKLAVQKVYDIADEWLKSSNTPDEVELGMIYWDLNEQNGFHSGKVIARANSRFNRTLEGLLQVPPPHKDKP